MRKFAYIGIGCAVISFLTPQLIRAETDTEIQAKIEETQRQRDALLEEQKRLQASLDELNKQGQTLQGTVKTLDASKKKLENDLKITQSKIKSSTLTIQKLETDINVNQNTIDNARQAIRASIKKLADYDSHSVVFDLLTYPSLTEVWTDTANILDTQDALTQEIDALRAAQEELVENKAAKEKQKTQLVTLSSELNGQKKSVENTQAAKQALLTETRSQEAQYQKLLADNIAKEKEFEAQLFQYESQLKASDSALTPKAGHGALGWPLLAVTITQQFGKTSSSGRLYASGTHNGVDFRASVGTPVMSVRGGIVQGMGNTDEQRGCYSYGRWVLIKHDNGLTSLYAHLSAATVTTGQAVSTGQVIGYSGGSPGAYGSGYSTGPHLHLGLFASAGVQIARYSTSINCKAVSIPIANPSDYLDPLAYLPKL